MNNKVGAFIRNFSYTLTANITSLVISIIIVLIVPKLIGIEDYGYWQLYLFYSSFVGFLQFGWNDGIYLRYGGSEYNNLDKGVFFSQFWMLTILQIILACIIVLLSFIFFSGLDKRFILNMVAVCMIIMGIRAMPLFIVQATNRMKEYAQVTVIDRIIYCGLIITFLVLGVREYRLLIASDLIGKFVSLLYAMYCLRDIVFRKISTFYLTVSETLENISTGINLMFANIASMLIIGVVRFGIEHSWNVSTFGKVSLTLNVSRLIMIFISALSIIMFPMLKRIDERKLPSIYISMRTFLMIILLGILIIYYPLKVTLTAWLPRYSDSLIYMALVFPMSVYDGKMDLLLNTYLKILRKEKLLLKINLISLILSLIVTLVSTVLIKNLYLAIVSIVFLLFCRCAFAEIFLSKILGFSIIKDIILELIITVIFILISWFINSWVAVYLYTLSYIMYVVIKKKEIIETINYLKLIIRA